MSDPFRLHTSALNEHGCPVDPMSPVPPPWQRAGEAAGMRSAGAAGSSGDSRFSEIGAMLAKWARNPELKPFEEMYRSEPNEAWFEAARDPDHPTQFEILTVRPEVGQSIVLFDYEVVPFGFSGVTALDYSPLPDNMLSGVFGYSLRIAGQDPGHLRYRLQPVSSTIRQQSFRSNQRLMRGVDQLTTDDFAISQANDYAAAAGFGTGLHPQTSRRYGARNAPFTEFVHDEQELTIQGAIFNQIDIPLAFIQASVAGYKGPSAIIKQIETALRSLLR